MTDVHEWCCVPYFLTYESETPSHALNCSRFTTEVQRDAMVARLGHIGEAMFGINYPDSPGDTLTIHDPNAALAGNAEQTYTYIDGEGNVTYSQYRREST